MSSVDTVQRARDGLLNAKTTSGHDLVLRPLDHDTRLMTASVRVPGAYKRGSAIVIACARPDQVRLDPCHLWPGDWVMWFDSACFSVSAEDAERISTWLSAHRKPAGQPDDEGMPGTLNVDVAPPRAPGAGA